MKRFSLFCLLLVLGVTMQAQPLSLHQMFVSPPSSARPCVWWHWMNGNITKDGIRKDLLWMNNVGIAGLHHFDAGMKTPQIVDKRLIYMDDGWKEAFRYSLHLLDSLQMETGITSAPGWSNTGGPWVKPANAMKKLVWRELTVEGGKRINVQLPAPYQMPGRYQNLPTGGVTEADKYYCDIAVLGVRLTPSDRTLQQIGAVVESSGGHFTVSQLTDGDLTNASTLPRDNEHGYAWIQYRFAKPQTIKSIRVSDGRARHNWYCAPAPILKHVEVSNDGEHFRRVCDIPHGGIVCQTVTIPPTTAKIFRIVFDNPIVETFNAVMRGAKPANEIKVAELVLYPVMKINHSEEKAGYASPHDMMCYTTPEDTDITPMSDVIELTERVTPDGRLTWNAPAGTWRIYRFGYSLTGKKNHPAPPEATGLEVDKLDSAAVSDYLATYLKMYHKITKGNMGVRGIRSFLIDSYEAGWETWTERMPDEFKKRCGYSLIKWLPVLTGQPIGSVRQSEQFLWDWRKTIGELIADNLYQQTARILKQWGMKTYFESHENGRIYLADGMEVKKWADIPMAAIWARDSAGGANHIMSECDIRETASTAHLYGKDMVACESFTVDGLNNRAYSFFPGNLKPVADLAMACGVNKFFLHDSSHQPVDDKRPGLGLAQYGHWFNRHETWAGQAKPWIDYLSRSSYLLQRGCNVADVLYYYGEDNCITGLFSWHLPDIPQCYAFDYINANALAHLVSCHDNRLQTPCGARYRLLFLDKNATRMSLPVLRKIAELVKQGAFIGGQEPVEEPSLNGDKEEFNRLIHDIWHTNRPNVLAVLKVEDALKAMAVRPDFICDDMSDMRFVHRTLPEAEIYWVSNMCPQARIVNATFRITGRQPQLWHPETGRIEKVSYRMEKEQTIVRFHMTEHDAVFIVFAEPTSLTHSDVPQEELISVQSIETPWKVTFGKQINSPGERRFDKLYSYTESTDDAVKYFSGTAVYTTQFQLSKGMKRASKILLDLGKVANIAEVSINGVPMGTLWKYPYMADITQAVHKGVNSLEVKVTNLWVNRLIGDMQSGVKTKSTYTSYPFYKANSPLQPSGLLGPVAIRAYRLK